MPYSYTDSEELRIYALYARAVAAFQLGGDMLPLAAEKAAEALKLMEALERFTPEQRHMKKELTEALDNLRIF